MRNGCRAMHEILPCMQEEETAGCAEVDDVEVDSEVEGAEMIWYALLGIGIIIGILIKFLIDLLPDTDKIEKMEENMHTGEHHYDR
jgi:uncharacterized membrane protein (DUF106 family)